MQSIYNHNNIVICISNSNSPISVLAFNCPGIGSRGCRVASEIPTIIALFIDSNYNPSHCRGACCLEGEGIPHSGPSSVVEG